MKTTFAFCGPIGSGKSTVSRLFAERIEAGWNGFGRTVKEIAEERGLPTNREGLQNLGAKLVKDERNSLCRRVVDKAIRANDGGVIDGLRHIEVLEELRSVVAPRELVCVYVDASRAVRLERVKKRDGLSEEQLAALEKHSTEIEVEHRLKEVTHFAANNEQSIEQCVNEIIQWARTQARV